MARRDDLLTGSANETLIASGVKIKGNLESDNDLSIDGILDGKLTAAGNISIGVNSRVKGNVRGTNVTVGGRVEGDITTAGEVNITESGRVEGNIVCSSLGIAPGAIFLGSSKMKLPETNHDEEPTEDTKAIEHSQAG